MSSYDDLPFLPVTELAPLLRSRQLSPVELTRQVLERIEAVEPKVNAYITVLADEAMAQAKAASATSPWATISVRSTAARSG